MTTRAGRSAGLRWVDAGNAGPFTLEGTRTFLVGSRRVAVIDPGPAIDAHVAAVAAEVERERPESVVLLVTHGHADHSGAAAALAARLGAPVLGAWAAGTGEDGAAGAAGAALPDAVGFRALADGERVPTDAGELVAVGTPGHAREHVALHWPAARAVFVGDLLLGAGDTTWVGEYSGCVADYLASLDRVEALGAEVLLPAHGPSIEDPPARLSRYRAHRLERIEQVARALDLQPDATPDQLVRLVYTERLPLELSAAARASVAALAEHVRAKRG